MERTDAFEIDLSAFEKNKKVADKDKNKKENLIEDIRPRLPRTNRTLVCSYCGKEKILNPDQYQALFDYWGSEEKIAKNFICKETEMEMKENPFLFWWLHHDLTKNLVRDIKRRYEEFRKTKNVVELQNKTIELLYNNKIKEPNFEFIVKNGNPVGMKIKNIPFVGDILMLPYEKNSIQPIS